MLARVTLLQEPPPLRHRLLLNTRKSYAVAHNESPNNNFIPPPPSLSNLASSLLRCPVVKNTTNNVAQYCRKGSAHGYHNRDTHAQNRVSDGNLTQVIVSQDEQKRKERTGQDIYKGSGGPAKLIPGCDKI